MSTLTIRSHRPADRVALERLAALDSRRLPHGDLVLGEVDGALLAAVRVEDGEAIADPFAPTADLVATLRLHAARLRRRHTRGRRRPLVRHRLRPRPA
jgi:hypothetical protein